MHTSLIDSASPRLFCQLFEYLEIVGDAVLDARILGRCFRSSRLHALVEAGL